MTVYLDSSEPILRVLLGQPPLLAQWGKWERAYTSELAGVVGATGHRSAAPGGSAGRRRRCVGAGGACKDPGGHRLDSPDPNHPETCSAPDGDGRAHPGRSAPGDGLGLSGEAERRVALRDTRRATDHRGASARLRVDRRLSRPGFIGAAESRRITNISCRKPRAPLAGSRGRPSGRCRPLMPAERCAASGDLAAVSFASGAVSKRTCQRTFLRPNFSCAI